MSDKKDWSEKAQEIKEEAKNTASQVVDRARDAADNAKAKIENAAHDARNKLPSTSSNATSSAGSSSSQTTSTSSSSGNTYRYDYSILDYLAAPRNQDELNHKYSVLRRTMFSDNIEKPEADSVSLRESVNKFREGLSETRNNIINGTSLQVRYYGAIPLILAPLVLFKRRRLRKVFYSTLLTSYFILPEPARAILDAK